MLKNTVCPVFLVFSDFTNTVPATAISQAHGELLWSFHFTNQTKPISYIPLLPWLSKVYEKLILKYYYKNAIPCRAKGRAVLESVIYCRPSRAVELL